MISDLKEKLPFLKKKDAEYDESEEIQEEDNSSHQDDETGATDISDIDADEEELSDQDSSLLNKLKSKIQSLQKKPAGKAAPSANEDKKKKIIYAVIGVGLLVILFSDEIFPPEPEVATPAFVKPVRKKPQPQANTEAQPTTETPAETTETVATDTPSDSPVDVTSTETLPTETLPDSTESLPDMSATDSGSVTETTPDTATETIPDASFSSSTDSVDGEATSSNDDNLTDQILQDLEKQAKSSQVTEAKKEYVSPPDYEYRGRGLVYNCAGKHWACVDAPSYKSCEDNNSSTKHLGKQIECYPFNVYESVKGCENMQNRMVSSSAKTNFCNE